MRKFTFLVVKLSLILCFASKFMRNYSQLILGSFQTQMLELEKYRGRQRNENFGRKKQGGVFDFASSNELWRATLDTIDFMPLSSANYSGGIIITDWYSEDVEGKESIKITIRFLTNEIRSDALNVQIFKKLQRSSEL